MEFISRVSKKYWDATHNVYAYIIKNENVKKFSDDGEPQGTAGLPTLDVLEKSGLTDCAVVITRYFGGIMLGAGGLVRAYSHTASLAVEKAGISLMSVCSHFSLTCDYNFYGRLSAMIPECGGTIESTDFADEVTVHFYLQNEAVPYFEKALTENSNGKYKATKLKESYEEISCD